MEADRKTTAEAYVKMDKILERVGKIEFALGLSNQKPKVFEDIDNHFADLKAEMALKTMESKYENSNINNKLAVQEREIANITSSIKSINGLLIVRENQINDLND